MKQNKQKQNANLRTCHVIEIYFPSTRMARLMVLQQMPKKVATNYFPLATFASAQTARKAGARARKGDFV